MARKDLFCAQNHVPGFGSSLPRKYGHHSFLNPVLRFNLEHGPGRRFAAGRSSRRRRRCLGKRCCGGGGATAGTFLGGHGALGPAGYARSISSDRKTRTSAAMCTDVARIIALTRIWYHIHVQHIPFCEVMRVECGCGCGAAGGAAGTSSRWG